MTPGRVLVLGVGNLLLQDEGVGIHVVRALDRRPSEFPDMLPPGTRVVDGGTLGLDLLPLLEDADAVVLVDAANLRREPGTVAVLRGNDLASAIAGHLSPHQVGIGDLLAAARLIGSLPNRVSLVAIQPADIAPGLELTPDVAAALPQAVEMVRAECWDQVRTERPAATVGLAGPAVPAVPG